MSYIRSKDSAIHYEEYGSGEPLILLPGLLGTIETHWRRFIPEFARRFHVIAVDLRGHGKTDNPSGELRIKQLIDDLHALFDTLQIEQACICGYSLGGYIGLAFGLHHPGTVRGLIMHATKFYWTEESINTLAQSFDPTLIMEKVPTWGGSLQNEHAPANGEDGWKHLLHASGNFIHTLADDGIPEPALALADFPVLVSLGDADEMIPRSEAERLTHSLPTASLCIIPQCQHAIQSLQKNAFLEQAISFFIPHQSTESR